jgi:hypothetical protein
MGTRVFTFYNLNEGVDVEEFKEWSRRVDQPTCARMSSCERFDVYLIGGGTDNMPSFDVVEDIDVESWEAWQRTQESEEFSQIIREWPKYGNAASLMSVFCEKI